MKLVPESLSGLRSALPPSSPVEDAAAVAASVLLQWRGGCNDVIRDAAAAAATVTFLPSFLIDGGGNSMDSVQFSG